MLHCLMHRACVLVACMSTLCLWQYLWGHSISYICRMIMPIARYLVLTCPCTCSAVYTMLLLHLTLYSHVRLSVATVKTAIFENLAIINANNYVKFLKYLIA